MKNILKDKIHCFLTTEYHSKFFINLNIFKMTGAFFSIGRGCVVFVVDGKIHRENGSAAIYSDGSKEWWVNDKLHRIDGPAVEYPDGTRRWWINGIEFPKRIFDIKVKEILSSLRWLFLT